MPELRFKLRGTTITPRHAMEFIRTTPKDGVTGGCRVICAIPVDPVFTGLVIAGTEATTHPYAPSSATATFDILITNDTGVTLTELVLHASHDGNGSLSSPTMPSSLAIGASVAVALTYSTWLDLANVELSIYVTGTKPDTSTATSNTLTETVVIDSSPPPPPPPEDPPPPPP